MAPGAMRMQLIRVLTMLVDTVDRLEVEVASTRSWSRCPHCGFKTRTVHDRHVETHVEFEGSLTRRLARSLVADAKVMLIRSVVRRHRLD